MIITDPDVFSNVQQSAGEVIDKIGAMTGLDHTVAAIALAALVVVAVVLFTKPIRLILKLLINTGLGFVALTLINKFGVEFGIAIAINWVNAVITGVFGVPGVAVLLALKWMGIAL